MLFNLKKTLTYLIPVCFFTSFIITLYFFNMFLMFIIIFSIFLIILSTIQTQALSYKGTIYLAITGYFLLLVIMAYTLFNVWYSDISILVNLGTLFNISSTYSFTLLFYYDYLSISFITLILFITTIVLVYMLNYFKHEPEICKLSTLLTLFSGSMCLVISSANTICFFFFWEMIGLTSFLLINFYYMRVGTNNSAIKAFTYNKISDFFIFIYIIFKELLSTGNDDIVHYFNNYYFNTSILPTIFFLVAASIKSAQFGFHIWLPDSMDAPVPASALIHSATLVSVGVYVILRLNTALILCVDVLWIFYTWYSVTAFYGGLVAMFQVDFKKLLAYSTISHCGFLCSLALSGDIYSVIIYLYLHGIFKAVSFILVGFFINTFLTQDLRYMSQPFNHLPIEVILIIFSLVNLAALPFSLGFFYKIVLWNGISNAYLHIVLIVIYIIACVFGVGYVTQVVKIFFTQMYTCKNIVIKEDSVKYTTTSVFMYILYTILLFLSWSLFFKYNSITYVLLVDVNCEWIVLIFYSTCIAYIAIEICLYIKGKFNITYFYVTLGCVITLYSANWVSTVLNYL